MQQETERALPRSIAITLVHGTWGRGVFPQLRVPWFRKPFWFEEGSKFRGVLERMLQADGMDATIHAFEWSGANSILERYKAAKSLAELINAGSRNHPDRMQFIIGHSHGGSVAMLSLRHMTGDARKDLSLVTFATPFIEVYPEGLSQRSVKLITGLLVLFCLGFSVLAFMPIVFEAISRLGFAANVVPDFLSTVIFLVGMLVPGFAAFYVFIGLHPQKRTETLIEATRDGVATDYASNMLALRGIDDEATLVLAVGAIGNRISFYLVRIVSISLTITLLVLLYIHMSGSGPEYIRRNLVEISSYVLWLSIPGLGLLLIVLSGFFKGVYGRELFMKSLVCQINTHSAPDQAGHIWVITLPPSHQERKGLPHALYDHERAVPVVVNWILKHARPGEPDSPGVATPPSQSG